MMGIHLPHAGESRQNSWKNTLCYTVCPVSGLGGEGAQRGWGGSYSSRDGRRGAPFLERSSLLYFEAYMNCVRWGHRHLDLSLKSASTSFLLMGCMV